MCAIHGGQGGGHGSVSDLLCWLMRTYRGADDWLTGRNQIRNPRLPLFFLIFFAPLSVIKLAPIYVHLRNWDVIFGGRISAGLGDRVSRPVPFSSVQ
jgi:hypothetical protein